MAVYECIVDGASRGQGNNGTIYGHGCAAVLIFKNKKLVGEYSRPLGSVTSNEAEFHAALMAIMICWAAQIPSPVIYSDSKVLVNAIDGTCVPNSSELAPLIFSIKEIERDYSFQLVHVKRKEVSQADRLANNTLDRYLKAQPAGRQTRKRNNLE